MGALLKKEGARSLPDIAAWVHRNPLDGIRSQRRVLLNTLRYMRTHGLTATPSEWTAYAENISDLPLAWDEAKDGRYRYRVPGGQTMPPHAVAMFLKATLDQTPPGWHASLQTRQHYRYVMRRLPDGFKSFVPNNPPAGTSLTQSMRALVGQKFPAPHSAFMEKLAAGEAASIATVLWPKALAAQKMNDKWVQTAFLLARNPNNATLANAIHADAWFESSKSLLPDVGVSLSFFEIIERLPAALGRPAWMEPAFIKMLGSEKDAEALKRGWDAVNLTESERFSLLLGLAQDYPRSECRRSLGDVLAYPWTMPGEERKALALKAYASFGEKQANASVTTIIDNAKEWIALLVPEMQPLLDLCGGDGPAAQVLQLQQFLAPAETGMLALPAAFDACTEMSDLVPK